MQHSSRKKRFFNKLQGAYGSLQLFFSESESCDVVNATASKLIQALYMEHLARYRLLYVIPPAIEIAAPLCMKAAIRV